jgi:hypothetical protein
MRHHTRHTIAPLRKGRHYPSGLLAYFVLFLGLPSGFAFWVCLLGLPSGFAFWVCLLGLPSGFAFWVCFLGLLSGFAWCWGGPDRCLEIGSCEEDVQRALPSQVIRGLYTCALEVALEVALQDLLEELLEELLVNVLRAMVWNMRWAKT